MNNTISVIIPFYNSKNTIRAMLDSIIGGTLIPDEIILVDDGSTDSSSDIAKEFAAEHPNVKYIRQDHNGVSTARNLGLSLAGGQWISFLDADDYVEPDMYALMTKALSDASYDGCICGYYTHKDNIITPYVGVFTNPLSSDDILQAMFTDDNIRGFLFTRLFRADLVKKLSFSTEIGICEDLLFQSQLFSEKSLKFAYVDKPLYHYIQNSSSATASLDYFKNNTFIYKPAYNKIFSVINKDYTLFSYNKILEYSMYTLLRAYKASGHDKIIKSQISQMQSELKSTHCTKKSWRRYLYEYAPILYGLLFV